MTLCCLQNLSQDGRLHFLFFFLPDKKEYSHLNGLNAYSGGQLTFFILSQPSL